MESRGGLPVIPFASQHDWERWLDENHPSATGVWLKLAKKGSRVKSLTHAEAVESALCYGWIDGLAASYDESFWLQRFTPRRARSKWSRINRERAETLEKEGRMKPAGRAQIEAAQRDGRWDAAYDSPSRATIPDDLQRALDENQAAKDFFGTLNSTNRYAILYRIQEAKKPETRARRIEKFVTMLNRGEKLYP